MRNISSASLTKLATAYGTEPINILEIQWVDSGSLDSYSDRDIATNIKGKIISIGEVDSVLNVSGGGFSQSVSVTLDDTDGSIKAIMDANDIHKRPCYLYQWFEGLMLSEKFLIFKGQVSSPITWSEQNRTVSFTIISKLEDRETGFSPEEGDFPSIPERLVGQPWPMVFGRAIDVPAISIQEPVTGTITSGIAIHDFTLELRIDVLLQQITYAQLIAGIYEDQANYYAGLGDTSTEGDYLIRRENMLQRAGQLGYERAQLQEALNQQLAEETPTVTILGGKDFPQGVSTQLIVNDAILTGYFTGETFTITNREHPKYALTIRKVRSIAFVQDDLDAALVLLDEGGTPSITITDGFKFPQNQSIRLSLGGRVITGSFSGTLFTITGQEDFYQDYIDAPFVAITIVVNNPAGLPRELVSYSEVVSGGQAGFFFAQAGSQVRVYGDEPIDHVASITPGSVLSVAANRDFEGVTRLVTVPPDLYTVHVENYGSITATIVTLDQPLSSRVDEGWDDTIYVTFESTVGPNVVDILEYLIGLYLPELDFDTTSFNYVKSRLTNYPANFALLDRRNVLQVLQEISRQSRCAIWLSGDTFFLRYLPEVPDEVTTFTESDVLPDSLELTHTPTEDLVTKITALWRVSYAKEPNKVILKHNVKKYGTTESEEDWYIYNNQELVVKSATFWLIRQANTWKKLRFRTPMHKLQVESLDGVGINFDGNYASTGSVTGVVEGADYDSASHTLSFEIWLPVKAGTMVPYDFAYPADVEQTLQFPTQAEEAAGFAGGNGPGKDALGELITPNVFTIQGYRSHQEYGDPTPSDTGDVAPPPAPVVNTATFNLGNPNYATPAYGDYPLPAVVSTSLPTGVIDIRTTDVIDSNTGKTSLFDTVFAGIAGIESPGSLIISTTALVGIGDDDATPLSSFIDAQVTATLGTIPTDVTTLQGQVTAINDRIGIPLPDVTIFSYLNSLDARVTALE